MAIAYRIDPEVGTCFTVWNGVVTAEELVAHAHRLVADLGWPASRGKHLTDLRTATIHRSITRSTLLEVASIYGAHPRIAGLKVAIVAGRAFTQAAYFERAFLRYQVKTSAFAGLEEACTWLDLELAHAAAALDALRKETHDT